MSLKLKTPLSINVQLSHTLAHHIKPTRAMNDVSFNTMYERLRFSAPAATELFRTKVINSLRLLCGLNVNRVNSLVNAIRRPGRSAIGNSVSETAEHHFIVARHICKYWRHTSRQIQTCADLVTTGDLFEEAERQMDLERTWENDQAVFHAFTNAEVNKNFNMLYKDFKYRCSSVRGCTNNPISYLMRKNLIPRDEADDPEEYYVMLDLHIIQRAMIFKSSNVHDVKLKNSGARAREVHVNTDNSKKFDLA